QRVAEQTGNWHPLAASLDAFCHSQPDDGLVESVLALADVYAKRMRLPGKAIETLQEWTANTSDATLVDELGQSRTASGDYASAALHLESLVRENPTAAEVWRRLAELYQHLGKQGDARHAAQALAALGAVGTADHLLLAAVSTQRPVP